MARSTTLISVTLLGLVALAGCFGGGDGAANDAPAYKGQLVEYDLYLKMNPSLELYPGTVVDSWLFSDSDDASEPGTLPGPTIYAREGDTLRVNFYITGAPMPHTVHWHGIHLPWDMDGVPYVSQLPIGQPVYDEEVSGQQGFTYEFKVNQSGTYFYHCHVDTIHHMDMGMYGALVVYPADERQDPPYDKEVILTLDEWDKSHIHQANAANAGDNVLDPGGDPEKTVDNVQSQVQDIYANHPTLNDAKYQSGVKQYRDYYPANYPAYYPDYDTFLINGKAYPSTEVLMIEEGQTLRVRVINAGFEWHALHLHGHRMYVTHVDGFPVPEIRRLGDASGLDAEDKLADYAMAEDVIDIGPGSRVDFYVFGNNPGPWMIHDHSGTAETNDHVNPGGMMTMLCYTSGWKPIAGTNFNPCDHGDAGGGMTSGELLMEQKDLLVSRDLQRGLPVTNQ